MVRAGDGHDGLFLVQRAQSRQQECLRPHRRLRARHHAWRGWQPDHRIGHHARLRAVAGALRPRPQDRERDRNLRQREHHRDKELRRIRRTRRDRLVRRDQTRPGCDRAQRPEEGRRLSRRERHAAHAFRRLYASRLPCPLEFLRTVLGLSLSRIAIRRGRRRAQRARHPSARGARGGE